MEVEEVYESGRVEEVRKRKNVKRLERRWCVETYPTLDFFEVGAD